jgi:hypothetical protein
MRINRSGECAGRESARLLQAETLDATANGKASQEVLLLRGHGELLNEHPSA